MIKWGNLFGAIFVPFMIIISMGITIKWIGITMIIILVILEYMFVNDIYIPDKMQTQNKTNKEE